MAPLKAYSETNLTSSLAVYLATQLLADGYLIYWHTIDAVQTPDAWYYNWSTDASTRLADPTLAAQVAAAVGLLTIAGKPTAKPIFPVRHTLDGSVPSENEVAVPYLSVEVDAERPGDFSGLGDRVRERFRTLVIYGHARDDKEQSYLRDALVRWFDDAAFIPVQDYDAGTATVFDEVECQLPLADSATVNVEPEATRYEVILNTRLRYEA